MRDSISYGFDDLPLLVSNGIEAGHVSGTAEIEFSHSGEWSVGAIYLDGYRDNAHQQLEVDTRSEIYLTIADALETGAWRDRIDSKVWSAIDDFDPEANKADHDYKLAREAV